MSANELITCESPTKAKSWTKYSGGIRAIPTMGHFLGLPKNEMGFDMETYQHKFIIEKKNVYANLRREAKGKIVTLGADEDREGYAIAYMTYLCIKDVAKEVYFSSTNEISAKGVKKALENKIKILDFDKNNYFSYLGRRISDRLIGYTLSPMANNSLNANLNKEDFIRFSIGRVQTIGVKLVYDKELEIRAFNENAKINPQSILSYSLSAFVNISNQNVELKYEKSDYNTKEEVLKLIDQLENYPAVINSIEKKNATSKVVSPYTTSTLQKDASSKLGFGVKKTMEIAQKLFEGKGDGSLITYHRTDKPILSDEFNKELRDFIAKEYGAEKLPASMIVHENKAKNAQEGHEGIRVTNLAFDSKELSGDEKMLYDLIRSRTIASQMASPVFKVTIIEFLIKNEKFHIKTKLCEETGYLDEYKLSLKKDEFVLPNLKEGQSFNVDNLECKEHKAKPPKRYTQASLVDKLEVDGIGRPSTYATIIGTILGRNYVREEGERKIKSLFLTETGERLIDWAIQEELANWILDYNFTAYLEDELDKVQSGKRGYKELLKEIHGKMGFKKQTIKKKNLIDKDCPCCGGKLEELEKAFKCENYKYDKVSGISKDCQFMVFKEPLGLTVDNLDELLGGKVYRQIETKYGLQDLTLDKKALLLCKSGKKLKKGQGLIIRNKDLIEGISCPICGDGITQTANQFSCENVKLVKQGEKFKNVGTCEFKVNKKNDYVGYELDSGMLQSLIEDKRLNLSNGKTILLDLENEYYIVDEEYKKRKDSIIKHDLECPVCKSKIYENDMTFFCSKTKKKTCKFTIFKENKWKGYTLNAECLKALLNKTEITVNEENKIVLDLDNKKSFLKISSIKA